jgi:hypothetical protein
MRPAINPLSVSRQLAATSCAAVIEHHVPRQLRGLALSARPRRSPRPELRAMVDYQIALAYLQKAMAQIVERTTW